MTYQAGAAVKKVKQLSDVQGGASTDAETDTIAADGAVGAGTKGNVLSRRINYAETQPAAVFITARNERSELPHVELRRLALGTVPPTPEATCESKNTNSTGHESRGRQEHDIASDKIKDLMGGEVLATSDNAPAAAGTTIANASAPNASAAAATASETAKGESKRKASVLEDGLSRQSGSDASGSSLNKTHVE
eukprot:17307-Heterococcus_DN1.PRE.1